MPVITVNSAIGGGAIPVGRMVAERLRLNFVDRLIFTQAARLVGSPVGALIDKEQRVVRFRDRLGNFIQTMLERSAVAGVSGEPYFGRGIETLPPETYMELAGETATAQKVDDEAFMEATRTVVMDLYRKGDVVIVGRGANVILGDTPDVIHVGLLAPLETRVERMMSREHFDHDESQSYVEELDQARTAYFRRYFNVHPEDPSLYHVMLNTAKVEYETATEIIMHAAADLRS